MSCPRLPCLVQEQPEGAIPARGRLRQAASTDHRALGLHSPARDCGPWGRRYCGTFALTQSRMALHLCSGPISAASRASVAAVNCAAVIGWEMALSRAASWPRQDTADSHRNRRGSDGGIRRDWLRCDGFGSGVRRHAQRLPILWDGTDLDGEHPDRVRPELPRPSRARRAAR